MSMLDPLTNRRRLQVVRELDLVDSPQEESLASISRLARQLLGVPVSVLSLVTDSRSVSVADGQPGAPTERPEYPLSHSLCKHVVETGEAFVVDDAREHPLVADHLAVRDYGVVAYAGFPLKMMSGEVVGAFCAVDHEPRRWSAAQLAILRDLSEVAVKLLEHRRLMVSRTLRDSVTGLPNPALFTEQVGELLSRATADERVSVVAVNLAEFSMLNDAWGPAAGDAVLAETGLRLDQVVSARRQPGRVCRLSADTFLVASTMKFSEPRGRLEEQLLSGVIARPFEYDGASQGSKEDSKGS